jgi:hypothetical protein
VEIEEDPKPKKTKAAAKADKAVAKGKKLLDSEDEEEVDEDVYEVEYVYGIRWHRDKEANFRGLQYRVSVSEIFTMVLGSCYRVWQ